MLKKRFIILIISMILLCFSSLHAVLKEAFIQNLGIEFESGSSEKQDLLLESDNFYNYYKNIFFIKTITSDNGFFLLRTENGLRQYSNENLNNDFHLLNISINKIMSSIFTMNIDIASGFVIYDKLVNNTYTIGKVEPRLTAKFDNFEMFGIISYQSKSYKDNSNVFNSNYSLGATKQISESSKILLSTGLIYIHQDVNSIQDDRKNTYVKLGYYWER